MHRFSACFLWKYCLLNPPSWRKEIPYHIHKNYASVTTSIVHISTLAYFFTLRFIHWLFPTYLLINKTNIETCYLIYPKLSLKCMNRHFESCCLSPLLIHVFHGMWLLTEQHRFRGPLLWIINCSVGLNAIYGLRNILGCHLHNIVRFRSESALGSCACWMKSNPSKANFCFMHPPRWRFTP
jgi:hypothetical protein